MTGTVLLTATVRPNTTMYLVQHDPDARLEHTGTRSRRGPHSSTARRSISPSWRRAPRRPSCCRPSIPVSAVGSS